MQRLPGLPSLPTIGPARREGVGGSGVPALYQWAFNFFYGENSQNLVLGII